MDFLADPRWTGIAGIVSIFALLLYVYTERERFGIRVRSTDEISRDDLSIKDQLTGCLAILLRIGSMILSCILVGVIISISGALIFGQDTFFLPMGLSIFVLTITTLFFLSGTLVGATFGKDRIVRTALISSIVSGSIVIVLLVSVGGSIALLLALPFSFFLGFFPGAIYVLLVLAGKSFISKVINYFRPGLQKPTPN